MDVDTMGNDEVRVAIKTHLFHWELFLSFVFSTIYLSTALWLYLYARNNMILFC